MDSEIPPVLPKESSAVTSAPKKSRTWLIVGLAIFGTALLGILGVVGVGSLFVLTAEEQPLSLNDKAAMLTIEDVVLWMEDFAPDKSKESFSKTKYLDGTYDMEYEYEDSSNQAAPYVYCSITLEKKVSDALISYKAYHAGLNIGLASGELEQVERNDLFQWGDASRFCLLQLDGAPTGIVFTSRKGTRVFSVTISGVYFDDSEAIKELLGERLRALERLPAP